MIAVATYNILSISYILNLFLFLQVLYSWNANSYTYTSWLYLYYYWIYRNYLFNYMWCAWKPQAAIHIFIDEQILFFIWSEISVRCEPTKIHIYIYICAIFHVFMTTTNSYTHLFWWTYFIFIWPKIFVRREPTKIYSYVLLFPVFCSSFNKS